MRHQSNPSAVNLRKEALAQTSQCRTNQKDKAERKIGVGWVARIGGVIAPSHCVHTRTASSESDDVFIVVKQAMAGNDQDWDASSSMETLWALPEPFGKSPLGVFEGAAWTSFQSVSANFLDGYARLVTVGFRPDAIGLAMLGATVNLYDMFEMSEALPSTLRTMAERIELRDRVN